MQIYGPTFYRSLAQEEIVISYKKYLDLCYGQMFYSMIVILIQHTFIYTYIGLFDHYFFAMFQCQCSRI